MIQLVRLFPVLRRLFRSVFQRGHNIRRQNLRCGAGQSQSSRNLHLTGVVSVNGVLTQANVDNAINDAQFSQPVSENGFWFGADDVPFFGANSHGASIHVGQSHSPENIEAMRCSSSQQTVAKNLVDSKPQEASQ